MPRGSAPGERRGGREKGTPNRRTVGKQAALDAAKAALAAAAPPSPPLPPASPPPPQAPPPPPPLDSLEAQRTLAKVLLNMTAAERSKEKPNEKWLLTLVDTTSRVLSQITPYEHSKRQAVRPEIAAELKPDGTVNVTISSVDADL